MYTMAAAFPDDGLFDGWKLAEARPGFKTKGLAPSLTLTLASSL